MSQDCPANPIVNETENKNCNVKNIQRFVRMFPIHNLHSGIIVVVQLVVCYVDDSLNDAKNDEHDKNDHPDIDEDIWTEKWAWLQKHFKTIFKGSGIDPSTTFSKFRSLLLFVLHYFIQKLVVKCVVNSETQLVVEQKTFVRDKRNSFWRWNKN